MEEKTYTVAYANNKIDNEMSDTSTNAVQNKVIKQYVDEQVNNLITIVENSNGTVDLYIPQSIEVVENEDNTIDIIIKE